MAPQPGLARSIRHNTGTWLILNDVPELQSGRKLARPHRIPPTRICSSALGLDAMKVSSQLPTTPTHHCEGIGTIRPDWAADSFAPRSFWKPRPRAHLPLPKSCRQPVIASRHGRLETRPNEVPPRRSMEPGEGLQSGHSSFPGALSPTRRSEPDPLTPRRRGDQIRPRRPW